MVGNILDSKWAGLQKTLNADCKNKATLHVLQQPARPGVAMKALKAPLQEGFFAILGKSFPLCISQLTSPQSQNVRHLN